MKKSKENLSRKIREIEQVNKNNSKKPMLVVGFPNNNGGILQR